MTKKKIKVVFLEDIPGVGRKFETAEVTPGYYRNYLVPNNLAELATDKVLTRLEGERKKAENERKARIAENKRKAEKLKGQAFAFPVKVGGKGQVYGSVTREDIAEKLTEEGYGNIFVDLHHPLKELGGYDVVIDFGDEVKTTIRVVLEEENKNS